MPKSSKKHPYSADKIYQSSQWKKLRKQYTSQHPICEVCKNHCTEDIHHIIPIPIPGLFEQQAKLAFDINNLIAVCKKCHINIHRSLRNNKKNVI